MTQQHLSGVEPLPFPLPIKLHQPAVGGAIVEDSHAGSSDCHPYASLRGDHNLFFRRRALGSESIGIQVHAFGGSAAEAGGEPYISSATKEEFWRVVRQIEVSGPLLTAVKALLASSAVMPDDLRLELEVCIAEAECGRPTT